MSQELISIIVPIYNTKSYLNKCLDSIVNQTYKNLEIICVDDGSTDGSAELLDEWATKDKRIIAIHKENGGVASARNVGLSNVTGAYIGWVDSDDWIDGDYFEKLYHFLLKYNADMAIAYANKTGSEPELIEGKNILISFVKTELSSALWCTLTKTILYSNESFEDVKIAEDVLMLFRIYEKCKKIIIYQDHGYCYNIREDSSVHQFDVKKYDQWFMTHLKINENMERKYSYLKPYCSYNIIYYISLIHHSIKGKEKKEVTGSLYKKMKKTAFKSLFHLPWGKMSKKQLKEVGSVIKFLLIG